MNRIVSIITIAMIIIYPLAIPLNASAKSNAPGPTLNQGKKWRIGYYEGGTYVNYPANLRALVAGLSDLGWMAPLTIPAMKEETASKPVWDYLVRNARSNYLEFVQDGYWCAKWSGEKRTIIKDQIIQRLNQKKDIDFMIAMGTWAGQDLANNQHRTPTMAVSVSDPVRSGISATATDSGIDHVHARCDPDRYIRQIRLFHRLAKFKKLGLVYENTKEGRTYAALDDVELVANNRNFKVIACEVPFSEIKNKASTEKIIKCHKKIAKTADAVFITVHRGLDLGRMDELTAPFLENKIPSWSQRGPKEVKKGVLFSISRGGFKAVGRYHADVMARIFNGRKPREIKQIFEDPKLIAINTKTANIIDFNIPNSIMRIADEIYETIEP